MTAEAALRKAAALFHEIVGAHSARSLIAQERASEQRSMTDVMREDLRQRLRTSDQVSQIAADGFELCLRALAEMGAKDVTIHECGEKDMEQW